MLKTKTARLAALSVFSFALLGASACGSDSTAPATTTSTAAVVGTYTLRSVDGVNLPAPAKDDKGVVVGTFTSGSVTLAADGSFSSALNYTLTGGSTGSSPASGTYSLSGSTISFVASGSTKTATFSGGNTITITDNVQTRVYTK